jgi:hypothetical protein
MMLGTTIPAPTDVGLSMDNKGSGNDWIKSLTDVQLEVKF